LKRTDLKLQKTDDMERRYDVNFQPKILDKRRSDTYYK